MKQILLVDTDAIFTKAVSYLLEKSDCKVSIAKDGKEATDALLTKQFDLVITDLFMPHLNGFELVNHIRQNTSLKHTPIFVVSDVKHEKSISNCFRLGANAYLKKPLDVSRLLSEIQNMVINRRNVAA